MLNARMTLDQMQENLEESIGVRNDVADPPRLGPMPRARDVGRRPHTGFGTVAIEQVIPDPSQPRDVIPDEALERLAQSIREKGQLCPIRVRWHDEDNKWIIVAGERRWQATKRAGLSTIDCYFHEEDLTHSQVLEQQLIENLLREDLRPMEEARAFCRLMEMNGWNGKQLAAALHIAPAKVSRSLALLKLPPDVQEQVASGRLSSRSAYELSKVTDKDACRQLASKAVDDKWTHSQAAKAVRSRSGKRRRRVSPQLKQTFMTEAGWKIVASHAGKTTYHDLKEALVEVMEEIETRINARIQIF